MLTLGRRAAAGNCKIYVGGEKKWQGAAGFGKTLGANGTLVLGNVQTAPGAVPKGPTTAFVGRMADISIWRTALSALDIQVRFEICVPLMPCDFLSALL